MKAVESAQQRYFSTELKCLLPLHLVIEISRLYSFLALYIKHELRSSVLADCFELDCHYCIVTLVSA